MIEIREAALGDIPAVARVHVQADWDTYSPLSGSQHVRSNSARAKTDGEAPCKKAIYSWWRATAPGLLV